MQKIDPQNWKRKFQFEKFSPFNSPFFNICADVDVTAFLEYVKANKLSFFQASYYLILKTVNEIECFRYRIRDGEIIVLDSVSGCCPIINDGDTFTFCYFDHHPDFQSFTTHAEQILAAHRQGLSPAHDQFRDDIIHSSIIPWVSFTSFEHAKIIGSKDTNPKIVLGKYYEENGKVKMPLSVSGHHALMDGLHVALYFKKFEEHLSNPEIHLK